MKFLEEQDFSVGRVEASRVGRWCCLIEGGYPGTCILSVLMEWIHAAMDFSY